MFIHRVLTGYSIAYVNTWGSAPTPTPPPHRLTLLLLSMQQQEIQKFTWNNAAEESFQRIKKELREAPVLGMSTEKSMYFLDTDASVVAISNQES